MIKYVFLDVSGTILHKPLLFENIHGVLSQYGYETTVSEIRYKHKLLTEVIKFPDRTDKLFYNMFNEELMYLLGIVPKSELIDEIYNKCTYLPWEKFDDTVCLEQIKVPVGIISNFNDTLRSKLNHFFGDIFRDVFVSEELGVAKPDLEVFKRAIGQSGFVPEEVLYVGDSMKLDIKPSLDIGMQALLIDREGFYDKSKFVINNLNQINTFISE